jgi:N-acetylmuramoyl-L-alanine amidase
VSGTFFNSFFCIKKKVLQKTIVTICLEQFIKEALNMKWNSTLIKIPLLVLVCLFAITASLSQNEAQAFSSQVIQHGATGDDVVELQSRLQFLGFYNKKIDGVFGWSTYWALRNFQYEFGLEIDGLGGAATKAKLEKASKYDEGFVREQIRQGREFTYYGGVPKEIQTEKNPQGQAQQPRQQRGQDAQKQGQQQNQPAQPNQERQNQQDAPEEQDANKGGQADNVPSGYSENDIKLMANAVYGEARGEPYVGQVAVAAVILNRVESSTFPNTISGVIFEPRAFTAVADGQIWLEPNDQARRAVHDALNGYDPSDGAIYYFNPATATSGWIWGRPQIKKIGKHIFAD